MCGWECVGVEWVRDEEGEWGMRRVCGGSVKPITI